MAYLMHALAGWLHFSESAGLVICFIRYLKSDVEILYEEENFISSTEDLDHTDHHSLSHSM